MLFPAPGEPQHITSSCGLVFVNGTVARSSGVSLRAAFGDCKASRCFEGSKVCSYGSTGAFKKNSSGVWNDMPMLAARSLQNSIVKGGSQDQGDQGIDGKGKPTCRCWHGPLVSCLSFSCLQHHQHKRNSSYQLRHPPADHGYLGSRPTCLF